MRIATPYMAASCPAGNRRSSNCRICEAWGQQHHYSPESEVRILSLVSDLCRVTDRDDEKGQGQKYNASPYLLSVTLLHRHWRSCRLSAMVRQHFCSHGLDHGHFLNPALVHEQVLSRDLRRKVPTLCLFSFQRLQDHSHQNWAYMPPSRKRYEVRQRRKLYVFSSTYFKIGICQY